MSLFEVIAKYREMKTESWIETTATFTGNRNKAASGTKLGYRECDYYEYEITYNDGNKLRRGFYTFYPLPDPSVEDIKGTTIRIKYNSKKPYQFVSAESEDDM